MSFAIEVPGDANPLTAADLCRVLQSATAANLIERQNAGQQLQTWEAQEGYFSGLQAVFLDKSLPYEIRFQAIIQLKNGVEKYWRLQHTIKNGIQPEEKSLIRSRLFGGTVNEEDKALALHNALTTAKIVRIDFPQEWPDAVGSIVGIVRDAASSGDQERLHGCLHILLRVTKELATARLRKFQTALQAVTPEVVFLLTRIYADKTPVWVRFLTDGRGDDDEADLALLNTLTCLKILRRLFITGYEAPHHDEAVKEFWSTSQVYFGQFLSFVSHDSIVPAPFQDMVGKQLLQFTKLHLNMAELQPAGFVMLPNSLQLVHAYWDLVANFADVFDKSDGIRLTSGEASTSSKSKMEGPLLECLALKGLLLMRACRRIGYQPKQSFKYRSAEAKVEEEQATQLVKTELFKGDFVIQMVNVIITHLFVFRRADLEAWESDPEEWEQAEQSEGNAFEWEVKPCAERLFLDLLTDHKELLIPPLLDYFQTASNPGSDIATKEAVYTALGLAAAHVSNNFDIDALIATTLVQDAQQQGPLAKVLRRRICILLSNWAPIKLGAQSRPLVYEIFRHFLDPKIEINDPVVRITAARQLKWILEDLEFDPQAFLPHTSATLSELIDLIKDVDVEETRIAVLETVRLLVTRMEEHIGQFGDYIMTVLPQVWDGSGKDDYMTKQSIIAILGALVMSMGPAAQKYHHFMIPLLTEAANSTSDLHFHLVDELLELWNNILVQVQAPASDELVGLIKFLLPMLEYQSATADEAMNALGAYMMLAPQAMVGPDLRRPTVEALGKAMASERRDPQREATRALENMVLIADDLGGLEGVQAVIRDMIETGLINKMMAGVREAYEASQTTGPHRVSSRINPVQVMDYLAVLSRVAYAMPEGFFFGVMEPFGPSIAEVWEWLSAQWFEKVRYMDEPTRQKLFLLALTRLLELPGPVATPLLLGKLQDYVVMWTDVILELQDGIADGTDSLIVGDPGRRTPEEYDTPKLLRELAFQTKDPVYRVNALAFVREHLQAVVERAGGEARFGEEWAVNVDGDVMDRFRALMAGSGVMG